ncbi:MAG TPA: DUF1810 domain-containing protein [Candidatus Dormibacteraeota bacterium]
MSGDDPFRLSRFLDAQTDGGTYLRAVEELRRGRKSGHWIWFVFPQLAGLGQSSTSRRFGISSLAEAAAYLRHPVLGHRLLECCQLLIQTKGGTAEQILGTLDALKLRSSMTLFLHAAPERAIFRQVLERYFGGRPDPLTEELLGQGRASS